MSATIRVARGCSVEFPFQITKSGKAIDLSTLSSCQVLGPGGYIAACPSDPNDATKRIVTLEGAATAAVTSGATGCVHWTDAAGKPDAETFFLVVYPHPEAP